MRIYLGNEVNPTTLAARAAGHAPHAIAAVVRAFQPDPYHEGSVSFTSPLNGCAIRLKPVTNQVSYYPPSAPMRHLPFSLEDAKRWAALDLLDAIARTRAEAQAADAFLANAIQGVLVVQAN